MKLRHVVGPNESGNSCEYFFDPMNVARDTAPLSCLFLRELPYLPMRDTAPLSCLFLRELPYLPMRDKAILATLRCCISGYVRRIKEIFTTIS